MDASVYRVHGWCVLSVLVDGPRETIVYIGGPGGLFDRLSDYEIAWLRDGGPEAGVTRMVAEDVGLDDIYALKEMPYHIAGY